MSTAQANPVASRLSVPLADAAEAEKATASSRSGGATSVGLSTGASVVAPLLPWLAEGIAGAAPTPWLVSAAGAGKGSGAGYASPTVAGDWSFLSDPSLSLEEKLSRFMIAVQKKLGDQLTDKMNDYKAKYGEGGTETKKEDSGGIFGSILGAIFPAGGIFDKVLGGLEKLLGEALKSLGGPLLAALATAVGLPALAPAALKVGETLGAVLAGAATGTKAKTTSSGTTKGTKSTPATTPRTSNPPTSTAKKGEAGSPDERLEMLEIQRLVEKQNQLFTLVSNLMKSMHDTSMVAIQNVR
ncbi:MAG: hypothetical protein H6Q88_2521 [Anaeromyxobacteraceae bacterium]|nr:hypothetical protein [Anaeromyxobacteraceae bacterium]